VAWRSQFHGCTGLGRAHSTISRLRVMRRLIENQNGKRLRKEPFFMEQ